MRQVPTYGLYGEQGSQYDLDILHCETIQSRSRLHDYRIRPHRHDQLFQTLFVATGDAEAMLDGEPVGLRGPCLVTVPATVVHGYRFSNIVEGLVVTLYQRQAALILQSSPEAARSLDRPWVVPLAGRNDSVTAIADSLGAVAREFAGHAPGRITLMQAHLAIAWLEAHRVQVAPTERRQAAQADGFAHVARFRDLVDADFQARLPVSDYARRLGVTEVHLRRLCRRHLGMTPLAVLNGRAVLEGKRLLVFSALGIKEIAAAAGFADAAYFSRFFLRETGLSPGAFRARQQTREVPPADPGQTAAGVRFGRRRVSGRSGDGRTG